MKRVTALLSICALVAGFTCFTAPSAESATIIKIAGMKPEGEPETVAMHQFGKYLEELSGGKYKVQVFPNSQLGKESAYIANTRKRHPDVRHRHPDFFSAAFHGHARNPHALQ